MSTVGSSPRISVALCTFNSAAFLTEQLESIASQTLVPHELVVADDGSSDKTLEIVATYGDRFAEFVILTGRQSGGTAGNFSRALRATTGDIVFLCDHDDVWEPAKVATIVNAIGTGPALAFTDASLIDATGAHLQYSLWESLKMQRLERESFLNGAPLNALLRRNLITGATAAVTAPLINVALPVPQGWLHDEWLAMVAAISGRIVALDEPLTNYRQHGANQVGVGSPSVVARLRRMTASRPSRHEVQLRRIEALVTRLDSIGASSQARELITAKYRFESRRAAYRKARPLRTAAVLHELASGAYARFASQGNVDAIRDLVVR